MKRVIWLPLLLLLISSCGVLRSAKQLNQRYFIAKELAEIESDLNLSDPSFITPKILYLTDLTGKHTQRLQLLQSLAPENSEDAISIAMLLEDGNQLIKLCNDPVMRANGWLLLGNWVEAKRLMSLQENPDPATLAMIYVAESDTLMATEVLNKILNTSDSPHRIPAARMMLELDPTHRPSLELLMRESLSGWERFLAQIIIKDLSGEFLEINSEDPKEQAVAKFLSARRSHESEDLKASAELLLQQADTPLRTKMLSSLRPWLIKAYLFPQALDVHRALPQSDQSQYPYFLLDQYAAQIEVLARYEAPDSQSLSAIQTYYKALEGSSFRSLWGNVSNVDNWAMERSFALTSDMESHSSAKPSEELYQQIRADLEALFGAIELENE